MRSCVGVVVGRAQHIVGQGESVSWNDGLQRQWFLGLAFVIGDQAQAHVPDGRLLRVLADWCQPFAGYHLYYPNRRQHSPAFALLVEAIRYRG